MSISLKRSNRELFIRNTFFNTSFNIINQIIALFILPLFIKNIGAEIYGIWVISGITLGYLGLIDLGFTEGVMRYISGAHIKKDILGINRAINTSVLLFFLIGLIILVIIVIFNKRIILLFSLDPTNIATARKLLLVSGAFAPFVWATRITKTTFQGLLRFKEYSILSVIQSLGGTMTMLYLVYSGFNIVDIAVITNVVNLVLWIPSLIVLFRILPDFNFRISYISLKVIREIMPFGLGVFYSQLITLLAFQADNIIIGIAVSMSAVTAYVVASKLFYTSYSYMGMLSSVIQPSTYQAYASSDLNMIDKIMAQGTKYMTILYTPVGYLGIIISPLFIQTWMGESYLQYAIWSQAFMAVFVLTSGFGMPVNLVFNSGRVGPPNVFKTISIILNLTIGILLVKRFGIGGPILGTLIAGLLGIATFPYFCKLINTDWRVHSILVLKIVLVNLPSTLIFYILSNRITPGWINLISFCLLILFVQFLTLFLIFFSKEEKSDVKLFLRIFIYRRKLNDT